MRKGLKEVLGWRKIRAGRRVNATRSTAYASRQLDFALAFCHAPALQGAWGEPNRSPVRFLLSLRAGDTLDLPAFFRKRHAMSTEAEPTRVSGYFQIGQGKRWHIVYDRAETPMAFVAGYCTSFFPASQLRFAGSVQAEDICKNCLQRRARLGR